MTDRRHDPVTGAPQRTGTSADDENVVDLVGRLTQQGAHLAREQVSLMQAEVREATQEIKLAVGAMAGAVVFGVAGLGVLLMGFAYLVGAALENLALGTIIVGSVTLVIAGILYASGKSKVDKDTLKPNRTIDTITDTPAAVAGGTHTTGGRHDH
ncbi:phage holin family protein [Erythrobacter sp. NFXS35]|uniref:phage holin family protein n=1 Tax=Erythrobacter sp. NFXS35 TaxID=2818436 RepID=UPI0032DE5017